MTYVGLVLDRGQGCTNSSYRVTNRADRLCQGKVNPTQEESMVMVSIQVIGEDNSVAFVAA